MEQLNRYEKEWDVINLKFSEYRQIKKKVNLNQYN